MVTTNEQLFDNWFATNYERLKADLLPTNLFGELYSLTSEDVFHNAYLLARESVLGKEKTNLSSFFMQPTGGKTKHIGIVSIIKRRYALLICSGVF